ncbi:Probable L-type lectin-domain containing receptor kinase S.7 [Dionaea muscipula]
MEKGELLLVYEFMPNGSLDKMLYLESHNGHAHAHAALPWPCRCNVTIGLASMLSYMHQECEQQVIHQDIKTSNVLLDANYNARLGDFGLAKLMDHDRSPVSTLTLATKKALSFTLLKTQFNIFSVITSLH